MSAAEHVLSITDRFRDDHMRAECSCGWEGDWRVADSPNAARVLVIGDHTAHLASLVRCPGCGRMAEPYDGGEACTRCVMDSFAEGG